eukprot:9020839-Pyramimonas_sp.AAC.1
MKAQADSDEILPQNQRWGPRCMKACVFCARRQWSEGVQEVYLARPDCLMQTPEVVAVLLDGACPSDCLAAP